MRLELPDISAELLSVDIQVKEIEKGSRVHGASDTVWNSTHQGEGELLRHSTCCSCVYQWPLSTKPKDSAWVSLSKCKPAGLFWGCDLLFTFVYRFSLLMPRELLSERRPVTAHCGAEKDLSATTLRHQTLIWGGGGEKSTFLVPTYSAGYTLSRGLKKKNLKN